MATLDEIFYKEFNKMLSQRKAKTGVINLHDLVLPPSYSSNTIPRQNKVILQGIKEDYYSSLNNTEAILLSRPNLSRRKFDYMGEFIKRDNNFVFEEVDVPSGCVAIVSDTKLGVPLKFKPKENFIYVDVINKVRNDGSTDLRYIYIIPKAYCFMESMVALVISLNKLRIYYSGSSMALQNGNVIYLYTIPFKPSKSIQNYRVICVKTSQNFRDELQGIQSFWLKNGVLFDPEDTTLYEEVKGRTSVAYETFPQVLDSYIKYNPEKSLANINESSMRDIENEI